MLQVIKPGVGFGFASRHGDDRSHTDGKVTRQVEICYYMNLSHHLKTVAGVPNSYSSTVQFVT